MEQHAPILSVFKGKCYLYLRGEEKDEVTNVLLARTTGRLLFYRLTAASCRRERRAIINPFVSASVVLREGGEEDRGRRTRRSQIKSAVGRKAKATRIRRGLEQMPVS